MRQHRGLDPVLTGAAQNPGSRKDNCLSCSLHHLQRSVGEFINRMLIPTLNLEQREIITSPSKLGRGVLGTVIDSLLSQFLISYA
jgi:hypothetical protein